MNIRKILQECIGFDWDQHNIQKNWEKHKVSPVESEQAFFNKPLIIAEDPKHSRTERRFCALGRTDQDRKLFIVCTMRRKLIRVISSRDMNKKERRVYEKREKEKDSQVQG